MRRMVWSLAAAAALIAGAALAVVHEGQIPPPKVVATKSADVPFELFRGNRVVVSARLNGRPTPAMLDTGAGATTLDRDYARSIGIPEGRKIKAHGAGGTVDAELVPNVTLEIGGIRLERMTVAVMDLTPIARVLGRPLPLVVGRELFNNAAIAFDWDQNRLKVTPSNHFNPSGYPIALAVERRGPFNFVKLSVAGLPPIDAVLDLGSGSAVTLPSDYWSKQPALESLRYAESQSGGVGGLHPARSVTLPNVQFAGRRFDNVPAILGGDSNGGAAERGSNLGIGMLKQFNLVLDLGHDRIFLAPRSAPVPFVRDRAGVGIVQDGDKLKVAFASPQGPAARAGLKAGDEIVAIDGQPVSANFYASPLGKWTDAAAGTTVTIALADGRSLRFQLEDYF